MTVIMLIFTMALFFGTVGTPLVRSIALKSGFIDIPKANRAHTEPTALMGGLAIYAAAISALVLILITTYLAGVGNAFRLNEFAYIVIGASLMSAVGLWDDRRPLPVWLKLVAQFVPVVMVFSAGVRVKLPLFDIGLWNEIINFLVTACWLLYITNALNYLDNADGIAIMTSATTSAFFLLIAVLNGQQLVSILAAAVLGASISFARYNLPLPKSTIFMGDSGSLFLGFLLAVLGIKIRILTNIPEITWLVPIVVLALPIFDTVLVLISRIRRGVSFFEGGVDHTNHRLMRLGIDRLTVVLMISLINGALGLVAIFITQASRTEAYIVVIALGLIALYVLWEIEFKRSVHFRMGADHLEPESKHPPDGECHNLLQT